MAKIGVAPPMHVCHVWRAMVMKKVAAFDAQGLSHLMYSLGKLKLGPQEMGRDLFVAWANACTAERLAEFTPKGISMTTEGLQELKLDEVSGCCQAIFLSFFSTGFS